MQSMVGCYNDTTPLDLTDPVLTIFSNVTHHDTQPDPKCLLLPIDSIGSYHQSFSRFLQEGCFKLINFSSSKPPFFIFNI